MDFPTSQLQAGVALTMFSPDVVPALYGQLNNSAHTTNRHRRRDVREIISEGDSEQHQHGRKSTLKKLGDFFRRKPYGSLGRSSQATIQSSQHEEQDVNYLRDLEPPQILSHEYSADLEDTSVTCIEDDGQISHNECQSSPETEKRKDASESSSHFRTHQRGESFHVNLTPDDVQRIAKEIYDQTIADVNLSLFSYWINESEENYEEAKRHIRELRLDHGYNLARIANVHLRKLMQDVFNQRPVYAKPSKQLSLRRSPGIPNLRDPGTDWCHKGLGRMELAIRTLPSLRSDPLIHALNSNIYTSMVRGLTNYRVSREAQVTLRNKISLNEMAMATSRTPTYSLFPRIDALPQPLRIERQRAVSEAVLRPVSIDSLLPPQRNYPPDTPDRPLPLSVRPSTAASRSSPSLPIGFTSSESPPPLPIGFASSESLSPLPFGFPSPGSALRVSNSSFPAVMSYTSSLYDEDDCDDWKTEKSGDEDLPWEDRVADIYERVVGLERPEQLDQVIEELQGLRALYCNTPTASQEKSS